MPQGTCTRDRYEPHTRVAITGRGADERLREGDRRRYIRKRGRKDKAID